MRPRLPRFWRLPRDLPTLTIVAVSGSIVWTLIGCLLAAVADQLEAFLRQWLLSQASFAMIAALYLGLLPFTGVLADRVAPMLKARSSPKRVLQPPRRLRFRTPIVAGVSVVGTMTTTQLGFALEKPTLYFMWATCFVICSLAGFATWHVVEVLSVAGRIKSLPVPVFSYSPSETRSLKRLATYFAFFGAAMTVGYAFALAGTLLPHWKADPSFVRFVQLLWPLVYVPTCLIVTTYPQLAIHDLIRHEKDRLISLYQAQINEILAHSDALSKDDIERVNALAGLIEKIEKSPNYAITMPIAVSTVATYSVNVASLFIPKGALSNWVQHRFFVP